MKDLHEFRIEGNDVGYTTKVTLDGQELKGITALRLEVEPMEPNRLVIEFIPGSVVATGKGALEVRGMEP